MTDFHINRKKNQAAKVHLFVIWVRLRVKVWERVACSEKECTWWYDRLYQWYEASITAVGPE